MVKFGIITCEVTQAKDPVTGWNTPVILLIGRTENGEKKTWRTPFYPYLYLTESDYLFAKEKIENLSSFIKEVEGSPATTLTRKPITKVILQDVKNTINMNTLLNKYNKTVSGEPVFTYEADLSTFSMLPTRFLIDNKIKSGVEIDEEKFTLTPIDMDIKLRKWYLDVEALSSKQGSYGPRKNEPIPILSYYDNYLDTLYTLYTINKKWDKLPQFPKAYKNHVILYFDNEGLMLECFCNMTTDYDWDLLTAWNLERYDIIKIIQRMIANHLNPTLLSPFRSFNYRRLPYKIKGKILFDMMRGFKRFTDSELRSYSLGSIAEEEELGIEKVPLIKSTQWIWDNEPETLFKRNVNDVLILKALDDKYGLIDLFDDLRKEFGVLFSEVLINYRIIDTALMRMINNRVVLRTSFRSMQNKGSYLGAVVIQPRQGLYKYVAHFDFNREYPSIIKAFNIGPETYREPDFKGQQVYTIEYDNKVYKFVKSPRSLLAELIGYFFSKRNEYEKKYQIAIREGNEVQIKAWYRKIFNIKKMTNAIYGVMDFPSFRLSKQECSAAVAVLGRIGVEQIGNILKSNDYELIYGDTDSVFIKLKSGDKEQAVKEATELCSLINDKLSEYYKMTYGLPSAPTGLAVKKVYGSLLLLAKKNYAGKIFYDENKGYREEVDMKGLETIRSDSSNLEKEVIENIIKLILDDLKNDAEVVSKDYLDGVKAHLYKPIDIAYPLQLKYSFKTYLKTVVPSHVKAAIYSNMFLNTDFSEGDKPRRLPILAKEKLNKGQKTLLNNEDPYPTEWSWEGKNFHIKGIAITEDMEIPSFFISRIDWDKVYERLKGKIDRIMELVK